MFEAKGNIKVLVVDEKLIKLILLADLLEFRKYRIVTDQSTITVSDIAKINETGY